MHTRICKQQEHLSSIYVPSSCSHARFDIMIPSTKQIPTTWINEKQLLSCRQWRHVHNMFQLEPIR